ncbi:c-type cytochrome biogenesis protein CcmI [Alteromonas sp. A079]|uniref:c-type cytochrome biogenesis protein CcmI n=1 Tax=Alteromonas sp. A079 TaxID=3410268 RepID=UPI003B9F993D
MSWAEFYVVVSGLITFVLLIIAFPWLRNKSHAKQDSLSNTQIVKQRLTELDREVSEGLISESDRQQAVEELKLALVDESGVSPSKTGTATLPLIIGAVGALIVGIVVYSQVNHMPQLRKGSQAIEALPELSQQLANGNGSSLTPEDVASLALAIRQRLREQPEDDTGWMYFGRLMLSLGQDVQAIEAIDKAVQLAPNKRANQITLAQALMTTGDESNLKRAQSILRSLLQDNVQNDNLALMMAVVSAQLGDLDNTIRYFTQVKDKLPADSDMVLRLSARIDELQSRAATIASGASSERREASSIKTGFDITVSLSEPAEDALVKEGFLIVFAQDALSDNRMPAAVIKIPLQDFPVTVTLSTDNAMMPQYSIESLNEVTLTARISVDGDVSVSKGEWQGQVKASVKNGSVVAKSITINKEL